MSLRKRYLSKVQKWVNQDVRGGGTLGKVSRKRAQPMQMSWGRSVPEGFDGFQEGLSRGSKKCSRGEGGGCVSEQSFHGRCMSSSSFCSEYCGIIGREPGRT